jgi:hypothetical protein
MRLASHNQIDVVQQEILVKKRSDCFRGAQSKHSTCDARKLIGKIGTINNLQLIGD